MPLTESHNHYADVDLHGTTDSNVQSTKNMAQKKLSSKPAAQPFLKN